MIFIYCKLVFEKIEYNFKYQNKKIVTCSKMNIYIEIANNVHSAEMWHLHSDEVMMYTQHTGPLPVKEN